MKLIIDKLYFISLSVLIGMGIYLAINMVLFAYTSIFKPLKIDAFREPVKAYTSLEVVNAQSSSKDPLQGGYIGDMSSLEYIQPVCGRYCLENGKF